MMISTWVFHIVLACSHFVIRAAQSAEMAA